MTPERYEIWWWPHEWGVNYMVAYYPDGHCEVASQHVSKPLTPNMLPNMKYVNRHTPIGADPLIGRSQYRVEEWHAPNH